MPELIVAAEGNQGMVVCFAQKLHAAGFREFPEALRNLGSIAVELFQCTAGNGKSHLEPAIRLPDSIQQQRIRGKITLLGDASQDGPVDEIVIIMRILSYVEESENPEPVRLMYLEIETKLFHKATRLKLIHKLS